MNGHLSDEEILDLLVPGSEAEPTTRAHLEACDACRARVEREGRLSKLVADLPRSLDTPRDLWPALRTRLAGDAVVPFRPRSRRLALRVAAVVAVFALGALAGYALRQGPEDAAHLATRDPLAAAAEVQRAGTAYVEAVARFRAVAGDTDPATGGQAREVALAAVHGAAFELARLYPQDATARGILALAREPRPGGDAP